MTHPFHKRKDYRAAMHRLNSLSVSNTKRNKQALPEHDLFIEERKEEFLSWLEERNWIDIPGHRKTFCNNHPSYPEFEFEYYSHRNELIDSILNKGGKDVG